MNAKAAEYVLAILGGLMIGLITNDWNWLPAIIFVILMLIAYAFLFRKRRAEKANV